MSGCNFYVLSDWRVNPVPHPHIHWAWLANRACLKGWLVGSAVPKWAQSGVWLHFCLPQPDLPGPKLPPSLGSTRTPESHVRVELGAAWREVGDLGAISVASGWLWRARAGALKLPRTLPPSRNPWPIYLLPLLPPSPSPHFSPSSSISMRPARVCGGGQRGQVV
jgi:hypothetical protein